MWAEPWLSSPVTQRGVPEVVSRKFLHEGRCQPLPNDEKERNHNVMVALVVMQLRIALQDVQDDVYQLLLQPRPLLVGHPCRESSRGLRGATTEDAAPIQQPISLRRSPQPTHKGTCQA